MGQVLRPPRYRVAVTAGPEPGWHTARVGFLPDLEPILWYGTIERSVLERTLRQRIADVMNLPIEVVEVTIAPRLHPQLDA